MDGVDEAGKGTRFPRGSKLHTTADLHSQTANSFARCLPDMKTREDGG